jgi:hypothetical protein
MGYLPDRKTRTIFVTGSTVGKNGRPRTIIVESKPEYAIVQLDGDKDRFSIAWEMIYDMAMKHHAACLAAEQKAHRKRKA